jgi:quercetin dioxygenase-like cupin family protein
MIRLFLLVATALLSFSGPVLAEERKGGDIYRLLHESDRVRVFEANFKPGAKLPMRTYPSHLIYMLTDGTLVFAPEGRRPYEVSLKAGEVMSFPAHARATENDSDQNVRVLVFEFRDGAASARSRAGKAKGKGKAKSKSKSKGRR